MYVTSFPKESQSPVPDVFLGYARQPEVDFLQS